MRLHTLHTGSVISGTLRHADLLCAFANTLALHQHKGNEKLILEALILAQQLEPDVVEVDEVIDALATKLQALCPPFYYFGTHPGDGSDFGVWKYAEEDEIAEGFDDYHSSYAEDNADWLYQFAKEQNVEES